MRTGLWSVNLREIGRLEDLGIHRRVILNGSSRLEVGDMDGIDVCQDMDRSVVKAVNKKVHLL